MYQAPKNLSQNEKPRLYLEPTSEHQNPESPNLQTRDSNVDMEVSSNGPLRKVVTIIRTIP